VVNCTAKRLVAILVYLIDAFLQSLDLLIDLVYLIEDIFAQLGDHFQSLVLYLFVPMGDQSLWVALARHVLN